IPPIPLAKESTVAKVLVLYYSAYGHIEQMAEAVAEGARETGAQVDIRRVPELVPEEVARKPGFKLDQAAPIARVEELAGYDAIIVIYGTHICQVSSQLAVYLDQLFGMWSRCSLNIMVGCAIGSTITQHGGQEATLFSILTYRLLVGLVTVGLSYRYAPQM